MLKRLFGVKVIFDMRGLWVDERVDGGLWDLHHWPDRLAFRIYKRIERGLLQCADHVVALTHSALPELRRLAPAMHADVSVIPCCADFEHFKVLTSEEREASRLNLGLPEGAFVLSYLGSLGTWYMLDEMLRFYITAARKRADIHFLVITRDWSDAHWARLRALGGEAFESRVHVVGASRAEVPAYVGASDVMLSFIKPAYSKLASSPTKLAEAHACGVPAICNAGIGDVDAQMAQLSAGALVDPADDQSVQAVIGELDNIRAQGGELLRERARRVLDLGVAAATYRQVYRAVEAG
jgi:glycosyltransferase involved in cell wall biosynthesis